MFVGIKHHIKIIQRNERHGQGYLRGLSNVRERRSLHKNETEKSKGKKGLDLEPIVDIFIPFKMAKNTFDEIRNEIDNVKEAWDVFTRNRRSATFEPEENSYSRPMIGIQDHFNEDFYELYENDYLMRRCFNTTLDYLDYYPCKGCNKNSQRSAEDDALCLNLMYGQSFRRRSASLKREKREIEEDETLDVPLIQSGIKLLDNIYQKMTVATTYMHMILHTQSSDRSLDDKNLNINITEEERMKRRERRSTEVSPSYSKQDELNPNKTDEGIEYNNPSTSSEPNEENERQSKYLDQICQRIAVAEAYLRMYSAVVLEMALSDNNIKNNTSDSESILKQRITYLQQLWMRMSHKKHPKCSILETEQQVEDQSLDATNSSLPAKLMDDKIIHRDLKSMENERLAEVRSFVLMQINRTQKVQPKPLAYLIENIKENSMKRNKRSFNINGTNENNTMIDEPRETSFSGIIIKFLKEQDSKHKQKQDTVAKAEHNNNDKEVLSVRAKPSKNDNNHETTTINLNDKKANLELVKNKTNFNMTEYNDWEKDLNTKLNFVWWYPQKLRGNNSKNIADDNKLRDINNSHKYAKEMYDNDPERPVPTALEYIKQARARNISMGTAALQWRSMKRAQLVRKLNQTYSGLPGQIHPDDALKDFDLTFEDINLEFNPLHPEGTMDDHTAYQVRTLPGGIRIPARQSRFDTYFDSLGDYSFPIQKYGVFGNEKNRKSRSTLQIDQKQKNITKFTWRCTMPVEDTQAQYPNQERGMKFLVWGGEVKNGTTGNATR